MLLAVDEAPHGERLAGGEVEGVDELSGYVEGDRDRVVGQPFHAGDGQRVEHRDGPAPDALGPGGRGRRDH